jgi:hypothetical protein
MEPVENEDDVPSPRLMNEDRHIERNIFGEHNNRRLNEEETSEVLEFFLNDMDVADRELNSTQIVMPHEARMVAIERRINPFFEVGGIEYDRDYENSMIHLKTVVYVQCFHCRQREWANRVDVNTGQINRDQ